MHFFKLKSLSVYENNPTPILFFFLFVEKLSFKAYLCYYMRFSLKVIMLTKNRMFEGSQ